MKTASESIVLKNGEIVVLRSPSASDATRVLEFLRTVHSESHQNLNEPADHWDHVSVHDEEAVLVRFENSVSQLMLTAWHSERVIGLLGLVGAMPSYLRKNAKLGMSVRQEYFGRGLGSGLIKHSLTLAKQIGLHRVELTVRTYNVAGIRLYEKIGFRRIGLLKDAALVDGHFVDEYAYELILG